MTPVLLSAEVSSPAAENLAEIGSRVHVCQKEAVPPFLGQANIDLLQAPFVHLLGQQVSRHKSHGTLLQKHGLDNFAWQCNLHQACAPQNKVDWRTDKDRAESFTLAVWSFFCRLERENKIALWNCCGRVMLHSTTSQSTSPRVQSTVANASLASPAPGAQTTHHGKAIKLHTSGKNCSLWWLPMKVI